MIRNATNEDVPQLLTLWQEAFGESEADAAFYLKHRSKPQHMLVMEQEGDILGMLSMLPFDLKSGDKVFPARYVFAVATRASHQRQGISAELLSKAHEKMKSEGASASVLVPASPALFDFYRKRGYETFFYQKKLLLEAQEITDIPDGDAKPCAVEDFYRLREKAFGDSALFARWDLDALAFITRIMKDSGGGVLRLLTKNGEGAAVCERRDGGIRISELALDGMPWQEALALACQAFPAKRYEVRLPRQTPGAGDIIPFGMIQQLGDVPLAPGSAPWLALAKD